MRGEVETAAGFTIEEGGKVGPMLRKWQPWDDVENGIVRPDVVPRQCGKRFFAYPSPQNQTAILENV